MFKFAIVIAAVLALTACPKAGSPPPQIVMTIAGAVCPVEQAIASKVGLVVAAQCAGDQSLGPDGYSVCGSGILQSMSAIDLCNLSVPAPSAASLAAYPQVKALLSAHPEWGKVGDIPASALQGAQGKQFSAELVQSMGIISSIVCPVAVPAIFGLLTPAVPAVCKCTQSFSSSSIAQSAGAACSAATALAP